MSQAVSAPITGACALSGGKSAKATEMSAGNVGRESPSRRAVLAGAALLSLAGPALAASNEPGADRSAWDHACHEYRRLKLRMDAYYALGPFAWLNDDYDRAKLQEAHDPATFDAALTALRAEEDAQMQYYRPVTAAAVTLIKTPAPDLDAVTIKIQAHKDMIEGMIDEERQSWVYIDADLRRLVL